MGFGVAAHSYVDGARFSNTDNIEEYIDLPVALFGEGDFFVYRVQDNSLADSDAPKGSVIVIDRSKKPESDDNVLLFDKKTGLKIQKLPGNTENTVCQGVIKGIIKPV